jgi:hypothetical protein
MYEVPESLSRAEAIAVRSQSFAIFPAAPDRMMESR